MQLVVYSSKHGSTKRCAEMLAEMLQADLLNAAEGLEVSLDKYDVVVLGSPVYVGQLLKPMKRFLEEPAQPSKRRSWACLCSAALKNEPWRSWNRPFPKSLLALLPAKVISAIPTPISPSLSDCSAA